MLEISDVYMKLMLSGLDLRTRHGKHAVHQLRKIKVLLRKIHLAGLDLVHVEDLIDQGKQMTRGVSDLLQAVGHALPVIEMGRRDRSHADNAVHGRTHVMAHAGEEITLRAARSIGRLHRLLEGLPDLHVLTDLILDILKAHRDADPAAGHIDLSEVHTVKPRPRRKRTDEIDGEALLCLKLLEDIRQSDLDLHALPVLLRHHGIDILRLGVGILRMT